MIANMNKLLVVLIVSLLLVGCFKKDIKLSVKSNKVDSTVYIDGVLKGKTPLDITLEEGNYQLKVKSKQQEIEKQLSLVYKKGSVKHIEQIKFKLLVPVKVSSDVDGAQVYIDDDFKGNTPLDISILEGDFTLKMVAHSFIKEKSITLIKKETPEIIKVNFSDELDIVGERAFWDETTKYKVPVDAGGGLLGFFVSKATNGGLTESFKSTWRGSIVDESGGYSNIELDNVEAGYGKYSYKGKSYRIDKEEEILGMIGSTVEKNIDNINIESLHQLKSLLKSAIDLKLKGSSLLQASSLLKLYSNKFLSKKSKSYQDNINIAEDYVQKIHRLDDAISIDKNEDRQEFLTIITRELFKANKTVIPFIDWERYKLIDDMLYDKEMIHTIKGRYEFGLIAQNAHLNGYKKALGMFLEHTQLDKAKISNGNQLSLVAPSTNGNVTMDFTLINNIPKLQSVKM